MPCRNYDDHLDSVSYYKSKLDEVTDLLCELCTTVERKEGVRSFSNNLKDWWFKHKEEDRKRKEEEDKQLNKKITQQQALKKLSKEEKEALGF